MRYDETDADRAPLPASYRAEDRHLGLSTEDAALPYADFFQPSPRSLPEHVAAVLAGGPAPAELGYAVDEVADRLSRPGLEALETGWSTTRDGRIFVAVHTAMPGVSAAMWDWWFGWHGRETGRYKLWHPTAHQFAALGEDRGLVAGLTDSQKYVGNVSYVDEYIGKRLHRLAIRFIDPARMGFVPVGGTLHVCARVTLSAAPIAIGWLVHQVRPTSDGAEMRSRFFLNDLAMLDLPHDSLRSAVVGSRPVRRGLDVIPPRLTRVAMPSTLGRDMVHHCATEMNHLAAFCRHCTKDLRTYPEPGTQAGRVVAGGAKRGKPRVETACVRYLFARPVVASLSGVGPSVPTIDGSPRASCGEWCGDVGLPRRGDGRWASRGPPGR